jgi:predicted transcriptional regulator
LTPRELDVISALWRRGSGTVTEVLEELDDDLAYTTILTVLRGLEQKGFVRHEPDGRAHRFYPEAEAQRAATGLLDRIVDKVYQGSPVRLVAHLVAERDLSAEELDELTALLDTLPADKAGASADPASEGTASGRRSTDEGEAD